MSEKSVNLYWKWVNVKKIRAQGNSGRCTKQISKIREKIPIKGNNYFKTCSSRTEEANIEKLAETN